MDKHLVYFFCDAGISTSIMVNKMTEVVLTYDLPLEIEAHSVAIADRKIKEAAPEAIILGPQVKYLENKLTRQFPDIKISHISTEVYANLDAESAVKEILILLRR